MADPTTQSNYLDISTKHVHFDWTINWEKRTISGSATHTLIAHRDGVDKVIFDTSALDITSVEVGDSEQQYTLGDQHKVMGSALVIPLHASLGPNTELRVKVTYSTTPSAAAIGWLEKEQTAGRQYEYLYTQCQAIYARSLAPLQDTPAIRITYSADVRSSLPVLLSALRLSPPTDHPHTPGDIVEYKYNQPSPIASYLIAIASGNLVYRAFPPVAGKSWSTGVWTEPETLEAAYWEFSKDTGRYVATAEELITQYDYGVYDLLVLPPSFPYGGMENACLTFVTPTLLAGDRSLVDVVAHEISHSWFGNNVGNANASHFWLNEGFTTYTERLLQHYVHSPAERDFSYIIGRKGLLDDLKLYESRPKYQRLVIRFEHGEDPDDAYSSVPYEKGSNFILYLERLLGGLEVFLPYVRDYASTFRGKAITTDEWKAHLFLYWEKHGGEKKLQLLRTVDWDAWLYGEGLNLPVEIKYDTSLATNAYALAHRWDKSRNADESKLEFKPSDLDSFNANQKVVFLERLQLAEPLPASHIHVLTRTYGFDTTLNDEIRLRWYKLALATDAAPIYASRAADWVVDKRGVKGRMKFCRPVFRAVYEVDSELARYTWEENRQFFHPIARKLIDKDLGLTE